VQKEGLGSRCIVKPLGTFCTFVIAMHWYFCVMLFGVGIGKWCDFGISKGWTWIRKKKRVL